MSSSLMRFRSVPWIFSVKMSLSVRQGPGIILVSLLKMTSYRAAKNWLKFGESMWGVKEGDDRTSSPPSPNLQFSMWPVHSAKQGTWVGEHKNQNNRNPPSALRNLAVSDCGSPYFENTCTRPAPFIGNIRLMRPPASCEYSWQTGWLVPRAKTPTSIMDLT